MKWRRKPAEPETVKVTFDATTSWHWLCQECPARSVPTDVLTPEDCAESRIHHERKSKHATFAWSDEVRSVRFNARETSVKRERRIFRGGKPYDY